MAYEKDPDELGALWLKRGAKGQYMTGEIGGVKVVCFPAKGGEGDKVPAWRVMKSTPKDQPMPNDQRTSVGRVVTSDDIAF